MGSPHRQKAILLVDHGSRLPEANALLAEVARLVERTDPSFLVRHAHMELAAPSIEEGFAACVAAGAGDVIVFPYMLGPGRHATRDIPRLAAEAAARHPGVSFRVTQPLGLHVGLAAAVLARVEEAGLAPESPSCEASTALR